MELCNKQGKRLGEFNHVTGEQIDPAAPKDRPKTRRRIFMFFMD
ncbi:hypothetical protein C3E98_023835 [Pseudomonas sp. MWU13-2625]|nr:hypothetical protein C3E98_023835 [Pseudomonas sp. MWU13-2625]